MAVKLPSNSTLTAAALDAGTLVTVQGGVNGIRTSLAANVTVQGDAQVTIEPSSNNATAPERENTVIVEGNANWRENESPVVSGPDIIALPPSKAITVVKELGCLPGPDFYGQCPAVSVTH